MTPMPGIGYAGMYSPLLASKEMSIACQDVQEGDGPRLFSNLLIALSYLLDVQADPSLHHGWRVAAIATSIARQIVPEHESDVFFAGLLHDVGAMGQFSHMVYHPEYHPGQISYEMAAHPWRGAEIVRGIPGLDLAAEFVEDHHEWWSGNGYPARKCGDEIPMGAQCIRVADTVDIRRKLTPRSKVDEAIEVAELITGSEISPCVSEAFRSVMLGDGFFRRLTKREELLPLLRELQSEIEMPHFRPFSDVTGRILSAFAKVVDAKHGFTAGHSERVSSYACNLGKALDLPHSEITKLRFAGLLHDTGKVVLPRSIIDKPGPLTQAEFARVKQHAEVTNDIVLNIAQLSELAWIASHHHEHWDGTGYPDGLMGEEIPLLSRILGVADAFDAITSPRAYRPARSVTEALSLLREASGTQFDPRLVQAAHCLWGNGQVEQSD